MTHSAVSHPTEVTSHLRSNDTSGRLGMAIDVAILVSNILPIIVVFWYKNLRDRCSTDQLIVCLSATEVSSVLLSAPFRLIDYVTGTWHGGAIACNFYQTIVVWSQMTSLCLVTFACAHHLSAMRDVIHYKKTVSSTNRRARIAAVVIYAMTLGFSLTPLSGLAPRALSITGRSCRGWILAETLDGKEHTFYLIFLVLGFSNFVLTFGLIVSLAIWLQKLGRKLCNHNMESRAQNCERIEERSIPVNQVDSREMVEFAVILMAVAIVLYLAWLPTMIVVTVEKAGLLKDGAFVTYSLLSTSFTGILNPIIYAALSHTYRRGYLQFLLASCKLIFGCPLTRADVISDISSHSGRMHTPLSSSTSVAALLSDNRGESGNSLDDASYFNLARSSSCLTDVTQGSLTPSLLSPTSLAQSKAPALNSRLNSSLLQIYESAQMSSEKANGSRDVICMTSAYDLDATRTSSHDSSDDYSIHKSNRSSSGAYGANHPTITDCQLELSRRSKDAVNHDDVTHEKHVLNTTMMTSENEDEYDDVDDDYESFDSTVIDQLSVCSDRDDDMRQQFLQMQGIIQDSSL